MIGHVEFVTAEMATKCLALDGCDMMNRYIKVARPMTPRLFQEKAKVEAAKPMGCRSIYVKNIPYDTTEGTIELTHSYLLTHSLTHALTYLLTYLLTHSLTYSLTYSLTHLLTYLLTHSLTHSLIL